MLLGFIQKISLPLLLIATTCIHAESNDDDKILCPSIGAVQQSAEKIDRVSYNDNGYIASSNPAKPAFYENKYGWQVSAFSLGKDSMSDAEVIKKGKEVVRATYIQKDKYAYRWSDMVVFCSYGPLDVMLMGMYANG